MTAAVAELKPGVGRSTPARTPDDPAEGRRVRADWTRALALTAQIRAEPRMLLADYIARAAMDDPDAVALTGIGGTLSYRALLGHSNRVSRWASAEGLAKGDVVALLMENRVDYIAIWLGLTRMGITVALFNDQLTADSLRHCIGVVEPALLIVSESLVTVAAAAAAGHDGLRLVKAGHGDAVPGDLGEMLATMDDAPLAANERPLVTVRDRALCIFTSGTTGLPKAANVSHRRVLTWTLWFAGLLDIRRDDRMYNCLPLHHSVGGIVAVGPLLVSGGSVVIRPKFSARTFWPEIVAWRCTMAQYIGELCRYLLAAPPAPEERAHTLRLVCGNGLRGEIWEEFRTRFALPRIVEFYAASEGTFSLVNAEGRPGAIGRVPAFLRHRFPAALVRFDHGAQAPARGVDGLCIAAGVDETGEALGRIDAKEGQVFEGYTTAKDDDAKIVRDVFAPGDIWYRTGDLMRCDAEGYFYFVDRIGDTWRWKGENVSAAEVAAQAASCPGVETAVAFGIKVENHDGRAGMVALVPRADFDIDRFAIALRRKLPDFAAPRFVRVLTTAIATTATFKPVKREIERMGFDPRFGSVYVRRRAQSDFELIGPDLFQSLSNGTTAL